MADKITKYKKGYNDVVEKNKSLKSNLLQYKEALNKSIMQTENLK